MSQESSFSSVAGYFGHVRILLYVAAATLFFKFVIKKCSRDPRLVKFSENFVGPYSWPIFGNSIDFVVGGPGCFAQYCQKYGTTFRMWFGKYLVVALSKADDIEAVLSSANALAKPRLLRSFKHTFGESISFAPVPTWKKIRKTEQPYFAKKFMPSRVSELNRLIYNNIEDMKVHVNGPEFNIKDDMDFVSFNSLTKLYFDFELDKPEKDMVDFHEFTERAMIISSLPIFRSWLHSWFVADFLYKKELLQFRDKVLGIIKKWFSDNNIHPVKVEVDKFSNNTYSAKELAKSFLWALHEMEKEIGTEDLMLYEVMSNITGGIHTTSLGTSSFLLAIAVYPEIQEKLYEEIYEVFGDDDRQAEESDLERLPYLDQVLKETLRRFTPIPLIIREIEYDTKIGQKMYPRGTILMINIAGVHLNPEYYPNPFKFNPENFTPEAVSQRHKFSYVPFSGGARICIGKSFAELSMKLRLVALLRRYSFHTTFKIDDMKLKSTGFLVVNENGYPVSIKLRKGVSVN